MKHEPKTKKPKKPSAKTIRAKKLKEWSSMIRGGGVCEVCGAVQYLQAHHLLVKNRYPDLMFRHENGICLCARCHKFGKFSFHLNAFWGTNWLRDHKPIQYDWVMNNL